MLEIKHILLIILSFLILIGTPFAWGNTETRVLSNCQSIFNDDHYHPKNFVGEGTPLSEMIKAADKACVDKILVNALPLLKTWSEGNNVRPTYYMQDGEKVYWNTSADILIFEEWKKLPKDQQKRFYFLLNGFNQTDKNAINYVKQILKLYPDVPIVGFGEIIGRHDDLSNLTEGGTTRANHPALDPIYELAAHNHWPVLLHNNIANTSYENYPTRADSSLIYLNEVKEALAKHPNTTIVLAHAGVSRNIVIPHLTTLIDELLSQYKNLNIDISWILYEDYIYKNNKLDLAWVQLIEKYPDRFLFGTDSVGGYDHENYNIKKYLPLLNALKPATAKKVAHDNFVAIFLRK